ncbi:MFS transporter [Aestuariispira insulae]|uniref:NNP family nitrate/nitrite transporter-like MFS transporter n=1 Tax=Aestuariispira insulae TaxID=1461337 RepID=A0A3D9HS46_9PROT|nr:MFS transporter [Aestuariispira insulae]RED52314.1 NNP family nitrate/nitrite transporter-like MFS transporter [Aestuariispira insulae]
MTSPKRPEIGAFLFSSRGQCLHYTWIAFFITILVWFNHAPLMAAIRDTLGLPDNVVKAILILNVALTIPAHIAIGRLVDRFGPSVVFSCLLALSGLLSFAFALADDLVLLLVLRFLLGLSGAGFVVGIRMIGEWFPAREVGLAEGVYAGWGALGSALAAMALPAVALAFGGAEGWRYAVAVTGFVALIYAGIYYLSVRDTPPGATYFKPRQMGAIEVTSRRDFLLCLMTLAPVYGALAAVNWLLGPDALVILPEPVGRAVYGGLLLAFLYRGYRLYWGNRDVFSRPADPFHQYDFTQVTVLCLVYCVTFGAELSVLSVLPLHFQGLYDLTLVQAGMLSAAFALMNLASRPLGGWLCDSYGRKKSLVLLLLGAGVGFLLMSQMAGSWPLAPVIVVTMVSAFFVQAGSGAVFAIAPLIKRRLTGQIAGLIGAYGISGAIFFLMIFALLTVQMFFLMITWLAIAAVFIVLLLLVEPRGQTAEILPDGTVQMIDVG